VGDEKVKNSPKSANRETGHYGAAALSELGGLILPHPLNLEAHDLLDEIIAESLVGIAVRFGSGCFVMADT